MLKSIALIMLIGMSAGWVCRKVKLPGLAVVPGTAFGFNIIDTYNIIATWNYCGS